MTQFIPTGVMGNDPQAQIAAIQMQRQQAMADALRQSSMEPVQVPQGTVMSPLQGLAKMLQAGVAGYQQNKIDKQLADILTQNAQADAAHFGLGQATPEQSQAALSNGQGPTVDNAAKLGQAIQQAGGGDWNYPGMNGQQSFALYQKLGPKYFEALLEAKKPTDRQRNESAYGITPSQGASLYTNELGKSMLDNGAQIKLDANGNAIAQAVPGASDAKFNMKRAENRAGYTNAMINGVETPGVPNEYLENQFNSKFNAQPQNPIYTTVAQTAQAAGVDPALAVAVATQESRGNQNAVSPAGAQGVMQLMPGTAKDLGVNPSDPSQNIQGGVNYLKQMQDKYGNETHALIAYNMGPGATDKWLAAGADPSKLPQETRNYVADVSIRKLAAPQPQQAPVIGNNPVQQQNEKNIGEDFIKNSYRPVLDEAKAARTNNFQLDVLDKLPISEKTGWGESAKASAANILVGFGYSNEQAKSLASNAQVFDNIVNQQNWNILNNAKGPQTEGDAQRALKTLSNLGNTPEANQFNRDLARALNNLKIKQAAFYQTGLQKNKDNPLQVDSEWQAKAPSIWDDPALAKWANGATGQIGLSQIPPPPNMPKEKWDEYLKLKGIK